MLKDQIGDGRKVAFTLAETLIFLVILGVVNDTEIYDAGFSMSVGEENLENGGSRKFYYICNSESCHYNMTDYDAEGNYIHGGIECESKEIESCKYVTFI